MKTALATQYYDEITKVGWVLIQKTYILVWTCPEHSQLDSSFVARMKKPTDNKTLIAILASCGALLIMIIILAVCASHHRKPYSENQVGGTFVGKICETSKLRKKFVGHKSITISQWQAMNTKKNLFWLKYVF